MKHIYQLLYAQPSTGWKFQHNFQQPSYSHCRAFVESRAAPNTPLPTGTAPWACVPKPYTQGSHMEQRGATRFLCIWMWSITVSMKTWQVDRICLFFLIHGGGRAEALINLIHYALQILCWVLPRRLPPNQDYNSKLSQCQNIPLF